MHREYRVRLFVVLCFLFSGVGVIGMISLLPSWSRAVGERRVAEVLAESVKKEREDDLNKLQKEMARSEELLGSLKDVPDQYNMSNVINGILGLRGNVKIHSISASRVSTTTISFVVGGIAPTRESLLAMKSRFEAAAPGNAVDLPISQLSKSSNIPFSMRLTENIR